MSVRGARPPLGANPGSALKEQCEKHAGKFSFCAVGKSA